MKRISMLIKFFTAFIVLLVFLLAIAGYVFNHYMLKYAESEISKSNIGKLKIIKRINDLLGESVEKDALRLAMDNTLNSLSNVNEYYTDQRNADYVFRLSKAVNILSEIPKTNKIIHSVYLYLDDSDYILTSNEGVVLKNDFKEIYWLEEYYQDIKSRSIKWTDSSLTGDGKGPFEGFDTVGNMIQPHIIMYSFPLLYISDLNGLIIININENALCELINDNDFEDEGYVFIINESGSIITHIDKSIIGSSVKEIPYISQLLDNDADSGYLVTSNDNKRDLIMFSKSDFNKWIYIGVFSMDSLMQRAVALRFNFIFFLSALIIIGGMAAYVISRKLYSPVNKLVQDIKARKGIEFKGNENDMALLSKAFCSLTQQEERFFDFIEINKRTLRNNYIASLVTGDVSNGRENHLCNDIFPFSGYVSAVIVIDRFDEFTSCNTKEQQHYIKLLILNVCEEILSKKFKCLGILQNSNRIAIIINVEETDSINTIMIIKECFIQVQKEMSKVLTNTVSVGIGSYYEDKDGIKDSFDEALEATNYRMVFGHESIIVWDDVQQKNTSYFYPHNNVRRILNHMNLGMKDQITLEVDRLFGEISCITNLSYENVIQIFNQVTIEIIRYILDANINTNDIFGCNRNLYLELAKKETLDDIKEWLNKTLLEIADYVENVNNRRKVHINSVLDYIHKNYKSDIGINDISDYVGISYSHVRKMFKDETGKSIVDYINSLRIKEAKRLLLETKLNVVEIAIELGYNSDQSLCRNFKKIEGITPSEFKETMNQNPILKRL